MLVSKGYLLRRPSELIICPNTGHALVSKKMFQHFKRYNNIFPKEWKPTAAVHNESDDSEFEKFSNGLSTDAAIDEPGDSSDSHEPGDSSDSPALNC